MHKRKKRVKFKIVFSVIIVLGFVLSSVFINRNFNLPNGFVKDGVLFIDNFVTKPFFNTEKYDKLVDERISNDDSFIKESSFFPLYRS